MDTFFTGDEIMLLNMADCKTKRELVNILLKTKKNIVEPELKQTVGNLVNKLKLMNPKDYENLAKEFPLSVSSSEEL